MRDERPLQKVRRIDVIRLLGDKENPHNRIKRIGYADWLSDWRRKKRDSI